jgi:hypothetical protein
MRLCPQTVSPRGRSGQQDKGLAMLTAVDGVLCSVTGWTVDGKIIQIKRTGSILGTRVLSCRADTSAVAVHISLVYSESSTLSGIAYEEIEMERKVSVSVGQMKIRFREVSQEKVKGHRTREF